MFNQLDQLLTDKFLSDPTESLLDDIIDFCQFGDLFQNKNKIEQAIFCYKQAIAKYPKNYQSYKKLRNILAGLNRKTEAREYFQDLVKQNSFNDNAYCCLGVLSEDISITEEENYYRKTLEINPNHYAALYNLGIIYNSQKKKIFAESMYRKVMELEPNFFPAFFNMGILLNDRGEIDEAIECYQRAIEIKPTSHESYYNMATMKHKSDFLGAKLYYKKAIGLNSIYVNAHYNLAILYTDHGFDKEAESHYRTAIKVGPDHKNSYQNLGVLLTRQGKLEEAEKWFRIKDKLENIIL